MNLGLGLGYAVFSSIAWVVWMVERRGAAGDPLGFSGDHHHQEIRELRLMFVGITLNFLVQLLQWTGVFGGVAVTEAMSVYVVLASSLVYGYLGAEVWGRLHEKAGVMVDARLLLTPDGMSEIV